MGVYGNSEAAKHVYLGLHALQHRGQESAGIVSTDGNAFCEHRDMGLVQQVFSEAKLAALIGASAIGHARYSTAGSSSIENAQPLFAKGAKGKAAVVHNGNFTNGRILREDLEQKGSIFRTATDTEVFLHLVARSAQNSFHAAMVDALSHIQGAYSLIVLIEGALYAIRDPSGYRPLSIGKLGDSWMVASETCAFDLVRAKFVRDVSPGEIISFTSEGMSSLQFAQADLQKCIFELVYFSRPDSTVFGTSVDHARENMGRLLAREHPIPADVIVPVPDSGVSAARGYSNESNIPFAMGITRNHYTGRTFIEPEQKIRDLGTRLKLNPVQSLLECKRVVLVDDSIVRGTTSKKIVSMVREAGASEVHVRISCPATKSPCYYGINTPTTAELIASDKTVEQTRQYIGATTLGYLSLLGLKQAVGDRHSEYCTSCFTGAHPLLQQI